MKDWIYAALSQWQQIVESVPGVLNVIVLEINLKKLRETYLKRCCVTYFTTVKLGDINKRTSWQIDQNFLWGDGSFSTKTCSSPSRVLFAIRSFHFYRNLLEVNL